LDWLSEHFKLKKNALMARQTFSGYSIGWCETINSFISRLQKLVDSVTTRGKRDNQVKDRAISFLNDKNLNCKSKLYREETLTLSKLLEIVSQY